MVKELGRHLRTGKTVINDHDLPAVRIAAHATHETAIAVGEIDDLHAVRTHHDADGLVAAMLDPHVACADGKSIDLTVPNECATAFLNDGAIGFVDDELIADVFLMTLRAHRIDAGRRRLPLRREELAFVDHLRRRRHRRWIAGRWRRATNNGRSWAGLCLTRRRGAGRRGAGVLLRRGWCHRCGLAVLGR